MKKLLLIISIFFVGCKDKKNSVTIGEISNGSTTTIIQSDDTVEYPDNHGVFYGDGRNNEIYGSWNSIRQNKFAYNIHADSIKISGDTIYLPNRNKFIIIKTKP